MFISAHHPAVSITDSVDVNLSKLWEMVKGGEPGMLQSMESQRVGHDLVTGQQQQGCSH